MQKYMGEVLKQAEKVRQRPEIRAWLTTVKHDSWCEVFNGGDCNCEFEVVEAVPYQGVDRQ